MCGIVGYIGKLNAKNILLDGLEKLEYRGYDSAGIALVTDQTVITTKTKGRIADLRQAVAKDATGTCGIGHTRWATHGVPNEENAHPHQSQSGRFTIVHNGVIDNYRQLEEQYLNGVALQSDTDTEIVVQLMDKFAEKGLSTEQIFRNVLDVLDGSFAFGLIDSERPGELFFAKNKSPLLIGVAAESNMLASDAMAVIKETDQFVEINDGEYGILTAERYQLFSGTTNEAIERAPFTASIDADDVEKGMYPHYMMKEIDEQPGVIRRIVQKYQDETGAFTIAEDLQAAVINADRLYIVACGTSYHAGLIGRKLIEEKAGIPVEVVVASEFGYDMPLLSEKPAFLFISQSGETADSRQVLVKVKALGHAAITLTNVPGSTLSREADYTLLLHAGPEIAVASTKAYTAQVAVLSILAETLGKAQDIVQVHDMAHELGIVANAMQTIIDEKEQIQQMVLDYVATTRNAFFLGRGVDYFVSLEAALKLKEISYIQAEGFSSGELKHGTIALIEDDTPVIALVTQPHTQLQIRSNCSEVQSRGAKVAIVVTEELAQTGDTFIIPNTALELTPLVSVVFTQLFAYYAALSRGCDVDKPRNLAKSVTVE
ncbi:MAG: glutamine--fructose-6-phosphate transaminase (isomerizing) [Brochothrix thermosphacta]|uniref:glutamine--fructose-6-phosphate transaminase (isomerizing) n=1 Tax=Brochothrix thermosphacta TaxID=2756 RepID=UPI003F93D032